MDDAQTRRAVVSSLLAGSWCNAVLFTLEVALCVMYMRRWKLERHFHYGFLVFLVNDAVGSLAICANVYLVLVESKNLSWPISVLLISTALSALIEQTFLLHRYWMVTKNTLWSACIMLLSVMHLALAISAVALRGPHGERMAINGFTVTAIAAVICTVVDVLIALSMVRALLVIRPMSRSTKHLIRSVCINALATGVVVAAVTLLAMISTVVQSLNRNIFGTFFAIMGRVYSLTILVNFVQRNKQLPTNSVHVSQSRPVFVISSRDGARTGTGTRVTLDGRGGTPEARSMLSSFSSPGMLVNNADPEAASASESKDDLSAPPRPSCVPSRYSSNPSTDEARRPMHNPSALSLPQSSHSIHQPYVSCTRESIQ
ncbi:hypothetical protein C8R47DRAFT_1102994 [Mycena vitilis]|nr:hypothetical protein C8R47DRAFT_1102994 [Mycena vitilis]